MLAGTETMSGLWLGARLLGTLATLALLAEPAASKTCSDRLSVCEGYCAKSEGNSRGCVRTCGNYHQACLSSGCWESKIVARQCGFERR
jgi:hypothetical protein